MREKLTILVVGGHPLTYLTTVAAPWHTTSHRATVLSALL